MSGIYVPTTTVADKHMGEDVGEPYRGKPDVQFDEGEVETDHDGEPAACDS